MIVVTGAAGFIASCMVNKLNNKGFRNIVVVDDFSRADKNKNLEGKSFVEKVHRNDFFTWLEKNHASVEFIYHLGARTDTTEFNKAVFDELNLGYSKKVWNACVSYKIPLIYASSAATYGGGEFGYSDNHDIVEKLKPLNPYGESKNDFDKWVLQQKDFPPYWAGVKFFNVYGPNEFHKSRMASVVYHSYLQIKETGKVKLFRSHKPEYADGGQLRDFIYVKDVIDLLWLGMLNQQHSGIYNIGTGKARSFLDLAKAVFAAMEVPENIEFIDTPEDIREKYQYFTEADMSKLHNDLDYHVPFYSLEDGIKDYVQSYLMNERYY
jgi:ADP-L-glycero-D-manno-heptose 6-epimerase